MTEIVCTTSLECDESVSVASPHRFSLSNWLCGIVSWLPCVLFCSRPLLSPALLSVISGLPESFAWQGDMFQEELLGGVMDGMWNVLKETSVCPWLLYLVYMCFQSVPETIQLIGYRLSWHMSLKLLTNSWCVKYIYYITEYITF